MHAFLGRIGQSREFTPTFVVKKTMSGLFVRSLDRKTPASAAQAIHYSTKTERK
jgi:hypothetical protein